jgi:hypothetical protein
MRLLLASIVLVCEVLACPLTARADAGSAGSASASIEVADPDAWLTAHGVKNPSHALHDPCCCVEITVGSPAEHALQCRDGQDVADGQSAPIAIRDVIRVVRAKKAVTVLDVWTQFENMDKRPGSPPVIKLELTLDGSGRTFTGVDPGDSENRCDGLRKPSMQDTRSDRIYREWIDRICASRGTYRWRGGRFQR